MDWLICGVIDVSPWPRLRSRSFTPSVAESPGHCSGARRSYEPQARTCCTFLFAAHAPSDGAITVQAFLLRQWTGERPRNGPRPRPRGPVVSRCSSSLVTSATLWLALVGVGVVGGGILKAPRNRTFFNSVDQLTFRKHADGFREMLKSYKVIEGYLISYPSFRWASYTNPHPPNRPAASYTSPVCDLMNF